MKKHLLITLLLAGCVFSSFAQSQNISKFNIGFDGAKALDNMNSIFNAGVGGSAKYEFHYKKIKAPLYITFEAGYETFFVKTVLQNAFVPSTTSYVPLKAGLKYFVIKGFYGEVQLGKSIYTQHYGGSAFDFSPGIGYSFPSGFEVGLRYEEWHQTPESHIRDDFGTSGSFKNPGTFAQLALRIAERF